MISEEELLFEMHIANMILEFVDDVDRVNQLHGGYTRSDLQGGTDVLAMRIIDEVTAHVQRGQKGGDDHAQPRTDTQAKR